MYEINGALFFGAAQTFQDTMNRVQKKPRVLILRMRNVPFIDATGVFRLKEVIRQFTNSRVSVILSGVNPQVRADLEKADLYSVLPEENLLGNIDDSIKRANEIMNQKPFSSGAK